MNDTVSVRLPMLCSPPAGMFREKTPSKTDGNDGLVEPEVYKSYIKPVATKLPSITRVRQNFSLWFKEKKSKQIKQS